MLNTNNMITFKIQDREAGNIIEFGLTLDEAEQFLQEFEKQDKKEGIYVPDFYEIRKDEE